MDPKDLGPRQLDGLREVANIGAGHAATALSQMVNDRVMVSVPEIQVVRLEDVAELLGDPNEVVSAVMMKLLGDVDRKSTRLNSSHSQISYAVFCLKKKRGMGPCARSGGGISAPSPGRQPGAEADARAALPARPRHQGLRADASAAAGRILTMPYSN